MSIQAAREYLALLWEQYQEGSKKLKGQILDELVRNLGLHRKAAIRLMNNKSKPRDQQGKKGGGRKPYSEEAKVHLRKLWKLMGYMGSRRMKTALPSWIVFYEDPDCSESVRAEIIKMSARSIERFLTAAKAELKRKCNTGTKKGASRFITEVPIRDLESTPTVPGHCEVDTVAHCGDSLTGTFAWTVNVTDIATGWTECEAIWGKTGTEVRKVLGKIEERLPFKLTDLYFDNGSEFLNKDVIDGFARSAQREQKIRVHRSRPYRKNDQRYVEQKNFTNVRQLFGYGRIDWKKAVPMMSNIYRGNWRLIHNYYFPQQKLISKKRVGSKVIRKMDEPKTPFDRLKPWLEDYRITELDLEKRNTNPISTMKKLKEGIRNIYRYFKDEIMKNEWGKLAV